MQGLKLQLNKAKDRVGAKATAFSGWIKSHKINWGVVINAVTVAAFTFGVLALLALMWLYVRPIQTANIKVPVATDQASYHPGDQISGIFFGEIYYKGEVRVLREVFCKNYHNIIEPPESARNGDFYDTQSIPRKIEGLTVEVGNLPDNIPVGLNCVLQFTNVYEIQTPFGIRRVEYQYYTQNFAIVTKERRLQLECESSGRKDCNFTSETQPTNQEPAERPASNQSSPDSVQPNEVPPTQNNTYNFVQVNNQKASDYAD